MWKNPPDGIKRSMSVDSIPEAANKRRVVRCEDGCVHASDPAMAVSVDFVSESGIEWMDI